MDRWEPPVELTKKEQLIMKRLNRVRPLFGFLRVNRHVLFDDTFQEQLEGMYRQTGAGDAPHAPAMLCMVLLLGLCGRLGRGGGGVCGHGCGRRSEVAVEGRAGGGGQPPFGRGRAG